MLVLLEWQSHIKEVVAHGLTFFGCFPEEAAQENQSVFYGTDLDPILLLPSSTEQVLLHATHQAVCSVLSECEAPPCELLHFVLPHVLFSAGLFFPTFLVSVFLFVGAIVLFCFHVV